MDDISKLTFDQFVDNCEALREQYQSSFVPFFNAEMIRCWKIMIYSLDMPEWRKDRIWETLNGDFEIENLIKLKKY